MSTGSASVRLLSTNKYINQFIYRKNSLLFRGWLLSIRVWMCVSGLCGPQLLIWLLRQRVVHWFTLKHARRYFVNYYVNYEGVNIDPQNKRYKGCPYWQTNWESTPQLYAVFSCSLLTVLLRQQLSCTVKWMVTISLKYSGTFSKLYWNTFKLLWFAENYRGP